MVTKTITITEDAYETIKGLKKESESFSDLFLRLGERKCTVASFFGILSGNAEEARQNLKKMRENFSNDAEKRYKLLFGHQRSN